MSEAKKSIGGLWIKTAKDESMKFFSGNIEIDGKKIPIVIFRNKYKEEGTQKPDFLIYESIPLAKKPEAVPVDDFEDDIPF